jgi:hypothetical protein
MSYVKYVRSTFINPTTGYLNLVGSGQDCNMYSFSEYTCINTGFLCVLFCFVYFNFVVLPVI